HAETGSGPMDRRFGLARLTVFTAGSAGGDLRIDGLGVDLAEQLRRYIVGRLTDANHAEQGGHAIDAGRNGLA
ncbi:MAG: PH domain-containing protein, partial [Gammaproteobacteria bacterium]|nr:PH domain-containing protein [Gammaproteobacteria bacterium]